jgi:DNA-binding transcriptional MerR regulator
LRLIPTCAPELARRTGVPPRRLRYYEQHGLLGSDRSANGYRDYAPQAVQQVTQIRGLIDAVRASADRNGARQQ